MASAAGNPVELNNREMMQCLQCSCKIEENGRYYVTGDMGLEMITVFKQSLGQSFDMNGRMCCQCLSSNIKPLPTDSHESDNDTLSVSSSVRIKTESDSGDASAMPETVTVSTLPVINDASRECASNQCSLTGNRCQSISDGDEKHDNITKIALTQDVANKVDPGASDPLESPKTKRTRTPYPPAFLRSPMRKRPKNHPLTSNEKTIALNVYKLIESIMTTYPYRGDIVKQVAEVMGSSRVTISRILREYKTTGRVSSPLLQKPRLGIIDQLGEDELRKIKEIVHQFDVNNEIVTVDKVLALVKEDKDLPNFSRTTFFKVLKKLNVKLRNNKQTKTNKDKD